MATVIDASKNTIKLDNGKTVTAQTGGWYDGQQYWGGSLSKAGVIHTDNPNQGGTVVNPTVVAATDVTQGLKPGTNEAFLASKNATPTSADQVNPYLSSVQADAFTSTNSPETKVPTIAELKTELAPTTAAPTPVNRVQTFNQLRTDLGVTDLETTQTSLKQQIADLQSKDQARQLDAEGKPVPLGVIGGRQTEIARQDQLQLDTLNRSLSVVNDELTSKYNTISTMVNYTGLDYQDAVTAYDKEFQQNLTLYGLVSDIKKENWTEAQAAKASATANLQIYANAITNGNMTYSNLPADQKLMIQKLEVQSGLPVGTIGALQLAPKDKIAAFSDDKTQAMIIDANGNMKVVSTGFTKSASSTSEAEKKRTAIADMSLTLSEQGGSDFYVSPTEWKQDRAVWIAAGLSGAEFDSNFAGQYVNYGSDGSQATLYGLPNPYL